MISDYQKVEFLIEHNYFEHHKVSDIIKDIKFQCITFLVEDWDIDLEESLFEQQLQNWIDHKFQDNDFIDFIKEQCFDDKTNDTYQSVYKRISSFLNQKIAKPKDTPATYFFIKTSKIKFEHTAYKLIKDSIVKLTSINSEALEAKELEEFKTLIKYKLCEVPDIFKKFKLKYLLEIYDETDQIMGLHDFENYLELPSIINDNNLENNILKKSLFIEGMSGSGKSTLAQRVAYEVSKENSFYIDFEQDMKNFNIHENETPTKDFLLAIKDAKGTLVLDNIQNSTESKFISKTILKISSKIDLKIILVAQNDNIENKRFSTDYFHNIKEEKKKFNFTNLSLETQDNNKLMILDFFKYQKKKGIIENLTHTQLTAIEKEFKSSIIYLKYSFENNKNIETLSIKNAKKYILHLYEELLDLNNCKYFKILLCMICKFNNNFIINKQNYNSKLNKEILFIDKLVNKKLLFKSSTSEYYNIFFSHKAIANILMDSLYQDFKTKENFNKLYKYALYINKASINSIILASLYNLKISNSHLTRLFKLAFKEFNSFDFINANTLINCINLIQEKPFKKFLEKNKKSIFTADFFLNSNNLLDDSIFNDNYYLSTNKDIRIRQVFKNEKTPNIIKLLIVIKVNKLTNIYKLAISIIKSNFDEMMDINSILLILYNYNFLLKDEELNIKLTKYITSNTEEFIDHFQGPVFDALINDFYKILNKRTDLIIIMDNNIIRILKRNIQRSKKLKAFCIEFLEFRLILSIYSQEESEKEQKIKKDFRNFLEVLKNP